MAQRPASPLVAHPPPHRYKDFSSPMQSLSFVPLLLSEMDNFDEIRFHSICIQAYQMQRLVDSDIQEN